MKLTDVAGVGPAKAEALRATGIETVEALAATDAPDGLAAEFREQARELLAGAAVYDESAEGDIKIVQAVRLVIPHPEPEPEYVTATFLGMPAQPGVGTLETRAGIFTKGVPRTVLREHVEGLMDKPQYKFKLGG